MPQRTSTTALLSSTRPIGVSACRSTCYHNWWPCRPGGCSLYLFGTVCYSQYEHRHHCQFSAV